MARPNKYRNQPVIVDGVYFPSKKEANRWGELLLLVRVGQVRNLRRQVRYDLKADGGGKVARYDADFAFDELVDGSWVSVVEDCKGFRTPMYNLKKKWMKVQYGITIRES